MQNKIIVENTDSKITMYDCPRWDGCSANVCPINGTEGVHFPEEEVCPYLREAAKGDKGIPPRGEFSEEIMDTARKAWANKHLMNCHLRKALNRAAKTESKRKSSNLLQNAA